MRADTRPQLPFIIMGSAIILLLLAFIYTTIPVISFSKPDDRWMLLAHENVHPEKFDLAYLTNVFTSFNDNQYSPVNTLYFYLIYQINGYDPYYYHLFPFLLHCLNTLIFFFLSREVLSSFGIANSRLIAWLVCLLWALHPLNVEPVIWVCGSKILLFTGLSMLSFYLFIKGLQRNSHAQYILATFLFLMACFCKEQAMVTPVMILLYVACFRLHRGDKLLAWKNGDWYILFMLAANIGFAIITINANNVGGNTPMAYYPLQQRVLLSFYCVNFYLTNLVLPINLHYHYPFPVKPFEAMTLNYYLYPLLFVLFCVMIFRVLKQSPLRYFYLLGIGVFFLQIVMVLQLKPMTRPAIMADRYMYIPSYALLLILLPPIVNGIFMKIQNRNKLLLQASFVLYVTFFFIYSHHLAAQWLNANLIK